MEVHRQAQNRARRANKARPITIVPQVHLGHLAASCAGCGERFFVPPDTSVEVKFLGSPLQSGVTLEAFIAEIKRWPTRWKMCCPRCLSSDGIKNI